MNGNIEIINNYLWAVNSAYIKQGYIQELTPVPEESENPYVSLTNDGIMILKKESELYPVLKKIIIKIMGYSDELLNYAVLKMRRASKPDAYEKLYLNVLEWELKRRCVLAEYQKNLPKPTFKDKINKFRKKVKKWLQSKQV